MSSAAREHGNHHAVLFFIDPPELASSVAGYLGGTLKAGGSAVVVVTAEHRAAICAALSRAGIDPAEAVAAGRLFQLDAGNLLERALAAGAVDLGWFDAVLGEILQRALQAGPVRVCGELVALLWAAGLHTEVIAVEEYCDTLGESLPFDTLCAYPLSLLTRAGQALTDLCRLHSEVWGRLPGGPVRDVLCRLGARRFEGTWEDPGLARRFVTGMLARHARRADAMAAALVVTELAANAVIHTGAGFTVSLWRRGDRVRIAVDDPTPELPQVRDPQPTDTSGRGLRLVSAYSTEWGVERRSDGGKTVWAELPD